ncbi:Glucan endo-1,3-beta-D-glucosidase [Apostasia shenzhenica]|uniref:Glucan endo-1,3-beta-D-glucosidase n=1 Tax=Apostasia shenzhenica TaxID=1088818 RepID=A0A2I0B2V7_9ASPA|nr:Glucan endo-1,3-beta-D-glucosidase [Apostasia shenzhenica]
MQKKHILGVSVFLLSKSGDLGSSFLAFKELRAKNFVSWTSLILAFANHGCGHQALQSLSLVFYLFVATMLKSDAAFFQNREREEGDEDQGEVAGEDGGAGAVEEVVVEKGEVEIEERVGKEVALKDRCPDALVGAPAGLGVGGDRLGRCSMDIGMKRRVARTWCIANPTVNHDYLQKDMDVLCDVVDCRSIKPGGSCYEPNDVVSHASVVFNLYYKFHASQSNTCNFGGDAMLTVIDPCKFT